MQTLSAQSVVGGSRIGRHALLRESPLPYSVFVAGSDRTNFVAAESIRRTLQANGRATAAFRLVDTEWSWRPSVFDEIIIYRGTRTFFAGQIESLVERRKEGSDVMEVEVRCTDLGVIAERLVIGAKLGIEYSGVDATIDYIVDQKLSSHGVTFPGYYGPTPYWADSTFNYIRVSEAIRQTCERAAVSWWIDFDRRLLVFSSAGGTGTSPITFTDSSANWRNASVMRTRSGYANRVIVKNSQWIPATWTDRWTGTSSPRSNNVLDGVNRFHLTVHPLLYKPLVTVNGTPATIVPSDMFSGSGAEFYYIAGGFGIIRSPDLAPLSATDVLEVSYPSPLPRVAVAEDEAEIAARGLYEYVEEAKDLSWSAMVALADKLLEAALATPEEVTIETDSRLEPESDFLTPGLLMEINMTKPLITGTYMLLRVDSTEVCTGDLSHFFRHSLRLTSTFDRRAATAAGYFSKLVERDRQAQDRIVERIAFGLAVTIDGQDNPGLRELVVPQPFVAQKDGWLQEVTLRFGSVDDGAETSDDIVIDVLKNGLSIFGEDKLVFPAGQTGTVVQWVFSADPLRQYKGDVYRVEILSADPAAKDGILEILVRG